MLTVLAALAALAVLFAAGALITHEGDVLRDAPADAPDLDLPTGALQPEDVPQLRFGLALRGYRMDEVDTTLVRVARELTLRDQYIAQLQQALADLVEPAVVDIEQQVAESQPQPEPQPQPGAAAPEPEQARRPMAVASDQVDSFAAAGERTQAHEPWPEQQWPESTSAVAETAGQVHAPTSDPFEDLFPEIAPPEPLGSSFGMYDRLPPDEDAPLGEPGVGFAASGGGATDGVRDSSS